MSLRRNLCAGVGVVFVLAGAGRSVAEPLEVHGRLTNEYYNQSIEKNTRRSFLNPGDFYVSSMDLNVSNSADWGIWEAAVRGRITNDTRVEHFGNNERNYHLQNSRLSLKSSQMIELGRQWEVDLSDYNEYYTPWSVTSAVLGGRATYRWENGLTAKAGGGRVAELEHNQRWDRYAAFGRLEKDDFFGWNVALHGTGAWDDPRDQKFFGTLPADQAARSFGLTTSREYLDGKLEWTNESDWSFRDANRTVAGRAIAGSAWQTNVNYRDDKIRIFGRGQRVTRDYSTLLSSPPVDLIGGWGGIHGDPWNWLSYDLNYGFQQDNVENTKITTLTTQTPDASLTLHPWLKGEYELQRNLRITGGGGLFMVAAGNKTTDLQNSTLRVGFDDSYRKLSFGADYQNVFRDNRTLTNPNADVRDNVVQARVRHEGTISFLNNRAYRAQVQWSGQWTDDILTGFKDKTDQVSISSYVNLYDNLDWNLEANLLDANKGRPRTDNDRKMIDTRLDYRFDVAQTRNRIWAGYRYAYSKNDDRTQDVLERVARAGLEIGF